MFWDKLALSKFVAFLKCDKPKFPSQVFVYTQFLYKEVLTNLNLFEFEFYFFFFEIRFPKIYQASGTSTEKQKIDYSLISFVVFLHTKHTDQPTILQQEKNNVTGELKY